MQSVVTVFISKTDRLAISKKEIWSSLISYDDFYAILAAMIIDNVLNFVMDLFANYLLEGMSQVK